MQFVYAVIPCMKILECIEGLDRASGVATFVHRISDELVRQGHSVSVTFDRTDQLVFSPPVAKLPNTNLNALLWHPDIVHLHGIWSRFSLRILRWCLAHRVPFIVSPHGGLMPRVFTHGRLKKFFVWHFILKPLLSRARAIHCTTETEANACRARGLRGPFLIAPLGVDMPTCAPLSENQAESQYVFYLGRLSEEKGLVMLLDAWQKVRRDGWRLVLAGPNWRNYQACLEAKIAAEKIAAIEFVGTIEGEAKSKLYREAALFVLPSPMENFSGVVLEALAHGIPAIATKGTPWAELETHHCGWWIDQGVEPLAQALAKGIALSPEERKEMGENGKSLAEEKYQWPKIVNRLLTAYEHKS